MLDVTGTLTVEDMSTQTFYPSGLLSFFGNRSHPVWLRLKLKPADPGPWWLLLQPGYVHLATVYVPDGQGGWTSKQTGSKLAFSERELPLTNPTLSLDLPPGQELTIYVRLRTDGSVAQAQVLRPLDAMTADRHFENALLLYISLAVFAVALAVVGWFVTGVRFWLVSGAFDAITLLSVLIYSGLGAKWFLPDAQGLFNLLHPLVLTVHSAVALFFFWRLLVLMNAPRWCKWGYQAGCVAALLLAGLVVAGSPATALQWLNQWLLAGMALWGVIVCWFARTDDRILNVMVRALWLSAALLLALFILPWLAPLRPPTSFILFPGVVINILTMLLSTAIAARFTQLRFRETAQLESQARQAELQLSMEQLRHEETAGFLAMLTHEVRNPMALVRQVVANLQRKPDLQAHAANLGLIDGAVQTVATVLDQCQEVSRLESGALKLRPQQSDLAVVLKGWLDQHPQSARIAARLTEPVLAQTDSEVFVLMVRNLVDNALKYSPKDSTIEFELTSDARGMARVQVVNQPGSAGLPDPSRVFTKFYRAEGARKQAGTGLGLYWVQRVVTSMEGFITLEQRDTRVCFELLLPLQLRVSGSIAAQTAT